MKTLHLDCEPTGQYFYTITEDNGSSGHTLVPKQYGTRLATTTVEQARSRFSFDLIKSSYTTNREYRTDGTPQKIDITYVPFTGTPLDDNACDVVLVDMVDHARGIHEKLKVLRDDCRPEVIHGSALASYDRSHYGSPNGVIGSVAE